MRVQAFTRLWPFLVNRLISSDSSKRSQNGIWRLNQHGSACATLRYTFDNEVWIHDLSEVTWRLAVPDATSQILDLADNSAMSIADFILRR